MFKYISRRVFASIIILFLIATVIYYASWIAMIEQYSTDFDFEIPFSLVNERYLMYLKNIFFSNDFGHTNNGTSYLTMLKDAAPYTILISLASLVFFIVFGVVLGLICAVKKDSVFDKIISYITTAFSGIPSFVLVWFLMLWLGWGLQLVPAIYPIGTLNILGLVIPVLSLALWPLSKVIQFVRGELIEGFDAEYMYLARAKGLTKLQGITRHLFRNTLVVLMPEITNSFLFVLASSFLVEIIYGIPGMSHLLFDSMIQPFTDGNFIFIDVKMATLITTFYVFIGMCVSLFFDIAHNFLDPRIRIGEKKFSKNNIT